MNTQVMMSGQVAIISISDPENKNALTEEFVFSIYDKLRSLESNMQVRAVVVCGDGKFFCSGGTKEQLIQIVSGHKKFGELPHSDLFFRFPLPVIVAMNGHAFGGGFAFGLYADIALFSDECLYSANFMKYGLTPGMGATFLLADRLGPILANEMMWAADVYYGHEIQQRNSQVRSYKKDIVVDKAIQLAQSIAESPRNSLIQLKSYLNSKKKLLLETALAEEAHLHARVIDSELIDLVNKVLR